jgi:hypothetical protein
MILVVDVVVMEEGVVLRRGSLVLCPFGGEEYCGVGDPFGPNLHQQSTRGGGRLLRPRGRLAVDPRAAVGNRPYATNCPGARKLASPWYFSFRTDQQPPAKRTCCF